MAGPSVPVTRGSALIPTPLSGKAYQVNVKNAQQVEDAVNQVVREFNGRLDVFIANAGIPWTKGPMVDGPIDHYLDVVNKIGRAHV